MCSRPFETRSLPSSLAATHRGFAFFVAFSKSSIRPAGFPIYVVHRPAAPFARCFPRNFTFYVALPIRFIARAPEAGEGRAMGHNRGRDNARKRAKRRKKNERLALAKKKQQEKK